MAAKGMSQLTNLVLVQLVLILLNLTLLCDEGRIPFCTKFLENKDKTDTCCFKRNQRKCNQMASETIV